MIWVVPVGDGSSPPRNGRVARAGQVDSPRGAGERLGARTLCALLAVRILGGCLMRIEKHTVSCHTSSVRLLLIEKKINDRRNESTLLEYELGEID